MSNYPSPKSSMPKKGPRSSLHPNGAPGFSETMAGLKQGLSKLKNHLIGAAAGMVGNVIGPLTNLKKSAQEGDEEAEKAYQDALAMLRGSGSSMADSLLMELGEQSADEAQEQEDEEPFEEVRDFDLTPKQTLSEDDPAEVQPALAPENPTRKDKVICRECGAEFRRLTQSHLSTHGMSPVEYREKYGFGSK